MIKPPLPFMGNKFKWARALPEIFRKIDADVVIDAYGGSGLLSHIAKRATPRARVYYNDYDGYTERLSRLEQTNELRVRIYEIVKHFKKNAKITSDARAEILAAIPARADFITLSVWLMFSGRYAKTREELENAPFFKKLHTATPYSAGDWLAGVEVVRADALELIKDLQERHKNERVLLVLDPPYIQTHREGYERGISLKHNLELMRLIRAPFLYFSSTTSEAGELLDFCGIKNKRLSRTLNFGASTDLMFFDFDLPGDDADWIPLAERAGAQGVLPFCA